MHTSVTENSTFIKSKFIHNLCILSDAKIHQLRVLTMYAIFCTTQRIQVILNNDKYFLVK